ncbi:MAG: prepilin peptidase, partial [Limnohabitans sp.]
MAMIETFLGVVLGLVLGSFANVVIHRLPRMLERQWTAAEDLGIDTASDPFNLAVPGSHCPQCNTPLRWYENLPLLSFL